MNVMIERVYTQATVTHVCTLHCVLRDDVNTVITLSEHSRANMAVKP